MWGPWHRAPWLSLTQDDSSGPCCWDEVKPQLQGRPKGSMSCNLGPKVRSLPASGRLSGWGAGLPGPPGHRATEVTSAAVPVLPASSWDTGGHCPMQASLCLPLCHRVFLCHVFPSSPVVLTLDNRPQARPGPSTPSPAPGRRPVLARVPHICCWTATDFSI